MLSDFPRLFGKIFRSSKDKDLFENHYDDPNLIVEMAKEITFNIPRSDVSVIWRQMVLRFPHEELFAEQYLNELFLSEHWSELNAFFQEDCWRYSPRIWLRSVRAALVAGNTKLAADRLRIIENKVVGGMSHECATLKYEIALLCRNFGRALEIADTIGESAGGRSERKISLKDYAEAYESVSQGWFDFGHEVQDYDVFVINLDQDTVRLKRTAMQIGDDHRYSRIAGVKGSYLPDWAVDMITSRGGTKLKGNVGCFLSHISAWEQFLAGDKDAALVLEDDACLIAGLPPSLRSIEFPGDVDICFVNERMAPTDYRYRDHGFTYYDVDVVVRGKLRDWSSAGTDGYIITRKGAERLLQYITDGGIAGDIDWRLIYYCISNDTRDLMIARDDFTAKSLEFHRVFASEDSRIEGIALSPPLVRQFSGGSVRLWDNKISAAHLEHLSDLLIKRKQAVSN